MTANIQVLKLRLQDSLLLSSVFLTQASSLGASRLQSHSLEMEKKELFLLLFPQHSVKRQRSMEPSKGHMSTTEPFRERLGEHTALIG